MARRSPEALLMRARMAETPGLRAKYATGGLSQPRIEADTQALLLRQLYLAHMERESYAEARAVAEQMIGLEQLGDVALHDASRACLADGDEAAAIRYLRMASRSGPASRRAFHLSCLGSLYYHGGKFDDAVYVLSRAVRWAAAERPLYRGQLALAVAARGEGGGLDSAYRELSSVESRGGYAQFVLGELAFRLGEHRESERRLRGFVERVEHSPVSVRAGLRCELLRAKNLLEQLSKPVFGS